MMGMIGGLAGAGGSIAGALIGADAQRYSADMNWAIALMNHYARERERWEAKVEARRVERKSDLGMTDASGNRTHFVPGVGWQVDLSPEQEALQVRSNAEMMKRLGPDAEQRRRAENSNEIRRIQESDRAKALFDAMRKIPRKKTESIENLLRNAGETNINRGFDDTQAIAMRQAMRTKSSSGHRILDDLAKKRGDALKDNATQSRAHAMTITPGLNNEEEKIKANLYNMFATRASQLPQGGNSPPPQLGGNDNVQLAARLGQGANELGFKAASMEGGRMPFVPPNYGMANAAGAIGTALQGLFRNANPQMGNPLMEEMDERYRGNQGNF